MHLDRKFLGLTLRFVSFSGLAACAVTVLGAWACIVWMPTSTIVDPFYQREAAQETAGIEDDVPGLYFQESGFGWKYAFLRGSRSAHGGFQWAPPYHGDYYRFAGWPFYALRSRVSVIDSQDSHGGISGGDYQRRRWELPWDEILYRGIATRDLPRFLHAKERRRIPLAPVPIGFVADVVLYMIAILILWKVAKMSPTRRQSQRPGLSRLVLRAARAAPARVVAHLER